MISWLTSKSLSSSGEIDISYSFVGKSSAIGVSEDDVELDVLLDVSDFGRANAGGEMVKK